MTTDSPEQEAMMATLPQWLTDPENQPNQFGVELVPAGTKAALREYGSHKSWCHWGFCTCGYDEALHD